MTSHDVKGQHAWSCDACPETYEAEDGDFQEAWKAARATGWVAFQVKGEFHHVCPACARDL